MRTLAILALLAAAPLAADNSTPHLLTVNGEGQTTIQANIADIQVGIEVQRKSAADAQQDLAVKLKPIMEKLKTLNADKLETGTMQILPEYDKNTPQKLVGYKGVITLQFSATAAAAGGLIDAAIAAGANELNNVSLRPSEATLKEAQLKSLALACDDATTKADVVLKTLKLENKGIAQVVVEPHTPGPIPRAYGIAAMAKGNTTLEVTEQEQTVSAHVQLQIKID